MFKKPFNYWALWLSNQKFLKNHWRFKFYPRLNFYFSLEMVANFRALLRLTQVWVKGLFWCHEQNGAVFSFKKLPNHKQFYMKIYTLLWICTFEYRLLNKLKFFKIMCRFTLSSFGRPAGHQQPVSSYTVCPTTSRPAGSLSKLYRILRSFK